MGRTTRKRGSGEGETDKTVRIKQPKIEDTDSAAERTASESQSLQVGNLMYASDCGMLYKAKVLNVREVSGDDGEYWGGLTRRRTYYLWWNYEYASCGSSVAFLPFTVEVVDGYDRQYW